MTARNISMAELSDRTGLSDTQINFILESEVVPSLAPLIKIARGHLKGDRKPSPDTFLKKNSGTMGNE